jgi:hypothetical protein
VPVTLSIDKDRRLVVTTAHGVVADKDFVEARRRLTADPEFDPSFDRIWDFHDVTESVVTEEVIGKLVAASPNAQRPICRAVVLSERPGATKAILHFISCTRQSNRRIAAFPDLASAEKWVINARVDLPPS